MSYNWLANIKIIISPYINYRGYTTIAINRTLVRQLGAIGRTLKLFDFSQY